MSRHARIIRKSLSVLFLLVLLVSLAQTATAQGEAHEVWENGYGEPGSVFFDAAETEDGYVLAGNTEVEDRGGAGVSSNTVGWVAKTNTSGGVVWERVFEGRRGSSLYGVTDTGDGYVAVGMYDARSLLNLRQAWAVGLSKDGKVEWVSDTFEGRDRFDDVVPVGDGGSIAVGTGRGRQQYAVRFSDDGTVEWQRTYGDGNLRSATADGYVFAGKGEMNYGRIESAQVTDVRPDGSVVWGRFYNETSVNYRQGNPGGEDIVSLGEGYAVASGGKLIVTDSKGELDWTTEVTDDSTISALSTSSDSEGILAAVKVGDNSGVIGPGEARGRIHWVDEEGVKRSLDEGIAGDLGQVREIIPLSNGYYHISGTGSVGGSFSHTGYAYVADLQPPEVELTVDPEEGEVGETEFTLTAEATDNGEIEGYNWDFDSDGETDVETSSSTVTRRYSALGKVETKVTVEDRSGNTDTSTTTVETSDTTPPTVNLTAPEPRRVATEAPAVLDAGGSSDNHRISEYRWDFDDDGSVDEVSEEARTTHEFSGRVGETVNLRLTVVDDAGNRNSDAYELTVAENRPPKLSVDAEKLSNSEVRLKASVQDSVGTPEVRWTDPEGQTAVGRNLTYASDEGERTFRVVAEDEYGATNTTNLTVAFGSDGDGPVSSTEGTNENQESGTDSSSGVDGGEENDRDSEDSNSLPVRWLIPLGFVLGVALILHRSVSDQS